MITNQIVSRISKSTRGPYDSVCVLAHPPLNPKADCSWNIKIIANIEWIVFGVCSASFAAKNSFTEVSWNQPGHGHYLLSKTGNTYSHTDPNKNFLMGL